MKHLNYTEYCVCSKPCKFHIYYDNTINQGGMTINQGGMTSTEESVSYLFKKNRHLQFRCL
jgi:hypothetical protein